MFHLVNITNTAQRVSATTLEELFNPLNVPWELPDHERREVTFSEYFKWLKLTITDDNWLEYLAHRIMVKQYTSSLDSARQHPEYKLLKQLLANHPKWLLEFVSLNIRTRTFELEYAAPERNYGFSLNMHHATTGNHDQYTLTGSLSPAIIDIVGRWEEHNLRPEAHDPINTNNFVNSHRCVLGRILHFVSGFKIINFRTLTNRMNLNAHQARTAMLGYNAHDETRGKFKFTVEFSAEACAITLHEPKRPASREQLSAVLNYSTDVLDYLPYNIRSKTEAKAPLYGIELETATNYPPKAVIAAQTELFFLCKQDGSISGNGSHRYEMVTVPATFKAHRRLWAEWFNKLDYNQFDTSKNTSNGMHVHIDRAAFSPAHLNKFTWFFINPANFDFLFEVSERPSKNDFNRWACPPHISGSKLNAIRSAIDINRGNRGIIHFKKNTTVEVRIFKGVVSYATIIKNLEFVDSVYYFTLETPLIQNTFKQYLSWLNSRPVNQYKLLREFLNQLKNLEQLTLSNSLKDYLFGITTPEGILSKLKAAPFKVTNKHLTVLNRERRKRTFVLNKDGTLSLAFTTGGKLASLDKEMQLKITRGSSSFTMTSM